jgi:4-hydroxy-tetrahydrodipicolinate synthase
MTTRGLRGSWPALPTPLTEGLEIDFDVLARHAHGLIEAGCAGVTPFGTTEGGRRFRWTSAARVSRCRPEQG